ncbi:MAG: DUF5717 family protein [Lachnospiraceae bacterium]|nr:DUF5717 family protein [Lachnospiraceae bacterium]
MRRVIDRCADGFFDYDCGKLLFSTARIEADMPQGQLYEGDFTLSSEDGRDFTAIIYTSSMRLVCRNDHIDEVPSADIHFVFDSTGLEAGDVIKGDIQVVSNAGEYYLPFVFSISYGIVESSLGNVRNLFHFTNQAQVNWEEAVSLFYSEGFAQVFGGNDRIHYDKFRGLSNRAGDPQAVDDFLVAINKKRPVIYSTDRTRYEYNDVSDNVECEFILHKSTWGNIDVGIECDAPFIRLEKERLGAGDFTGNDHLLKFTIRGDSLHEGRNYGIITVTSKNSTFDVQIVARHRANISAKRASRREKKNLTTRLMRQYIEFRMKKTNVGNWVRESMKIVERMNSLDDKNPVSRLYQAQLLVVQRRENEAQWVLEHVEKEMNIAQCPDKVRAYFLYLQTLASHDEAYIDSTARKVAELFEVNPNSFEILWTMLYLDEDLADNATRKISLIENMCERGCTSPIMYIEAYNFFVANTEKLSKLSRFELRVLLFATRMGVIDSEVLRQLLYLAGKQREYDPLLYKLLCNCYDITAEDEIVEVVATMLIKGNISGPAYFGWFDKAVRMQLRITKLFEYYMYSVPADYDGLIPKSVLMYFGFRNDMNYHRIALLYANLIMHKREYADTYETYREHMQVFAVEQIEQDHIDGNLAKIYEDVLFIEMIKPEMARHLARILFAHEVKVTDPEAKNVVLIQSQFEGEMKFRIENGYAYPTIYSGEYTLFTEDSEGRRRLIDQKSVRKLLNEAVFIQPIRYYVLDNVYFDMYLCEGRKHYVTVDDSNVEYCRELAESKLVNEYYKRDIRMALIRFYYDNDQITALDEFLLNMDIKVLSAKDRAEVVKYMTRRGMTDQAYEIMSIYGTEEIDAKDCVGVCSHMIQEKDKTPDNLLIKLCYYAFKNGKYDEVLLRYLVENYNGLTKQLRDIWKAARNFDIDTFPLMERLIIQMLYTHTTVGEKEDIFEEYSQNATGTKVQLAYLSYCSFEYFAKERLTDERVFTHITNLYRLGEPINDACKLALLKYYSEEKGKRTEKIKAMLKEFLVDFMHRNTYFRFFANYADLVPEISDYLDKTIIEYRTNPGYRVMLHYILEDGRGGDENYHTEEMRNMFGGLFTREFILFFGEDLQYYITEEQNGKEVLTASDSLSVADTSEARVESRYTMLNDMVVSRTVKDENTLLDIMREYVEADAFAHKVFKLR